jgi:LuxR family transcriptional regulator, maltose regulon positive regulatory protein
MTERRQVPAATRTRNGAHAEDATHPGQGGVVVATKLHIPAPRRHEIARSRLVDLLADDEGRRLALVCAPPGAGKTTLLAEWHAAEQRRRAFAWLSIDRGDNDPVRFWSCVIEALRTVAPGFGADAEAALQAPRTSLVDEVVPLIVNELHTFEQPTILVFDDYHEIAEPAVHESLAVLVDHLPPGMQVAIASRADPPLPLPRLRVRRELTEIRAADLGFNAYEAAALLNAQHGLDLSAELVGRLNQRTEGWAAGLQLAALSLKGRHDAEEFIDSFAGDDRQVVDYLAFEVLDRQDADTQRFLLRTSILDRLCGSLCDAVADDSGSAERLESLMRSGLFVLPLDERQEWYRYHHLFGDLLRHELARTAPEALPKLHGRATAWLQTHGLVEEAIGHALAAGAPRHAEQLVGSNWRPFFNRGCLTTVRAWLAALPDEAFSRDARLWLARAWTALDGGELDTAAPLFEEEVAAEARPWRDLLRALHGFKRGDVRAARTELAALGSEGDGSVFWQAVAACLTGVCDYWLERKDAARGALERAQRLAAADSNALGALYALGYLALLDADERDWPAVERRVERIHEIEREEPRVREHFVLMVARLAEGRLRAYSGQAAEADTAFRRAVEVGRRGAGKGEMVCALVHFADTRRSAGDLELSRALVAEARTTLDRLEEPLPFAAMVQEAERRSHLGQLRLTKPAAETGDALSGRELAVLRLLPTGLSQREIGDRLYVSVNTVKTHVRSVYRKLDAPTRDEAVVRARELGLL